MKQKIKWGIIGPGRIARAFAEGLKYSQSGELIAVASRSLDRAKKFSEEWQVPHYFGSYHELASFPEIEAVYIATPHSEHRQASILCMESKKHVLCEKPLAVNAEQIRSMILTAQKENVLLMEGMWSRFPPLMSKVREFVQSGTLGEIFFLQADFGFLPKDRNPKGRLFNPELAGGSILDIGVYPVSFASMILGTPSSISTVATLAETGVDEIASSILIYENGAHALVHSSLSCETAQEAFIAGTKASIRIHKQCWKPQKLTLRWNQTQKEEIIEIPFTGNGFNYEADHFGYLIQNGIKDSDIMPLKESLSICQTMDKMRADWGLQYPFEKKSDL